MRRLLDLYADIIERTLQAHGVHVQVVGGRVHPRFVTFEAVTLIGQKVGDIKRREEEIALALNAPSVRVARQRGKIVIEVPRDNPRPVHLLPLLARLDGRAPAGSAVLGLADSGSPLLLCFGRPESPHALVAGTTGCGKTELLRTIAASLAALNSPRSVSLVLVGKGFEGFGELPHLARPIVEDSEEALGVLAALVAEMESRLARGKKRPRIVAILDELGDLLMASPQEMGLALTRLTQRGRNVGLHVVAATQKPTAAVLGSLAKANFPVRIVGSVASPEDAKVAAGIAGTGAERLLGRGDFLCVAHGQIRRFQAAYVPPKDLPRLLTGREGRAEELGAPPKGRLREWVRRVLHISDGRGGHNRKPPTEEMVEYALRVREETGEWPSKRAIRAQFRCNNRRATETLEVARERWNGKKGSRAVAFGP